MARNRTKVTQSVNVPARKVWDVLSAWGDQRAFMPKVIERCTLDKTGRIRSLKIVGQRVVLRERLLKFDEKTRTLAYGIIDGPNTPVPFVSYESTIKVKEVSPRRCTVEWSGAYEPKKSSSPSECREFATAIYGSGIAGAAKLAKKRSK